MSFLKAEHLQASHNIRVCLIKGGDQWVFIFIFKKADIAKVIPLLQDDSQIDLKRLVMLSLFFSL